MYEPAVGGYLSFILNSKQKYNETSSNVCLGNGFLTTNVLLVAIEVLVNLRRATLDN